MKIQFDNVNFSAATGPNVFASRLAKQLIVMGHDFVDHGREADVTLVFIERSGRPLAKRVCQRLDGIWFSPKDFYTKNAAINDLYTKTDAVIWQSDFDREMSTKWWGLPKRGNVIRNGIDTTPIKELTIKELIDIRNKYDKIFVCSSNWHPQKRLLSNLQLFEHVRKTQFPNSCMFVMGNNPYVKTTDPHVFYTGSQPPEIYLQIFAAANWMFHLAWADHSPNCVIEALSQGTPVVCSSVGGTKELVGDFGIVIEDKPYNYELFDYDNPPLLDVSKVVLPEKSTLGQRTDIDIKNIAESYLRAFEEIL